MSVLHRLFRALCHTGESAREANILIRIRSLFCTLHKDSVFRALTTIPKYFDRTFQYNVGERHKEGFGVEYQNIKKPIIMVQAKLPSSIFSHF